MKLFQTLSFQTLSRFKVTLTALLVVLALGSSAKAIDTHSEMRRKADNTSRLQLMAPVMRPKVRAVLSDLESHGHRPLIDAAVFRSPAQQMQLYRNGRTKVTYSFHTATTKAGKPDSLAADITDIRWGWSSPKPFWLKLASSARSHELHSGAYFGLSSANKARLTSALAKRDFAYSGPIGWDPAHIEPTGISLYQAKAGKRPYS